MIDNIVEKYPEEMFLKADGFDQAIIGVETKTMRLIYSISECIRLLVVRDGMSLEEALEYLDYNVINAFVGDQTPIWCDDSDL